MDSPASLTLATSVPISPQGTLLTNSNLIEAADELRKAAFASLPDEERSEKGQFGTPTPVAQRMAAFLKPNRRETVRVLDAGAGAGTLSAAVVERLLAEACRPASIVVTAIEVESDLTRCLQETLERCAAKCSKFGVKFDAHVRQDDFIELACSDGLFPTAELGRFDVVIQNPPYRKLRSDSPHRRQLRRMGIEVSNLYAAFVALGANLLCHSGELVVITPRSFCNGPYFKSFRRYLLSRIRLSAIHVFDSRRSAFKEDSVLQENIILSGVARDGDPATASDPVRIQSSSGTPGDEELEMTLPMQQVVSERDYVIQLLTDGVSLEVVRRMQRFSCDLSQLGTTVSTGRVVDFRARPLLQKSPGDGSFPLIYPVHLRAGQVTWPVHGAKKPNALANKDGVDELLVPPGTYVLVKRFSAKEQRRRVEATVFDSALVAPGQRVGFENHLNYFHVDGAGVDDELATGLAGYLNSSLVDLYFRLFSGHTQVNATDLRSLPYPSESQLRSLSRRLGRTVDQEVIDEAVEHEYFDDSQQWGRDPMAMNRRVGEAQDALRQLGFPRAQSNERSALVLLSLLDIRPDTRWADAKPSLVGITEMMTFFSEHYGKTCAPNSRETVRRQTVHQFLEAGLIIQNPDDPTRPTNSGKNVYQVAPAALGLLRSYGTASWHSLLSTYMENAPALAQRYAQEREMELIPVAIKSGETLKLSPGGQNVLVKSVIEEFIPRFAPGAKPLVVGDTADKWAYLDEEGMKALGLSIDTHGKFPDIVALYEEKNWLLLIEAVTSHGPVDAKRHKELRELFAKSSAPLVFVTTFKTKADFRKYLADIAWETEVWVADSPTHMVHFDGKRFLGPYEDG